MADYYLFPPIGYADGYRDKIVASMVAMGVTKADALEVTDLAFHAATEARLAADRVVSRAKRPGLGIDAGSLAAQLIVSMMECYVQQFMARAAEMGITPSNIGGGDHG